MNKIMFLILDVLGIAIITLLSFGFFPVTGGMILGYIFLIIATLMQLLPMVISKKTKDIAYKISLHTILGIYLVLQFIISLLGYTLLNYSLVTISISSTILLLLSIACILIILQIGVVGDNTHQSEKAKAFFIEKVICDLEKIKTQVKETEMLDEIEKVIEKAHYSNLNSPKEASQTELNILEEIENIKKYISKANPRECKVSCEKLITLFTEREMLCKLYK